MRGIVGAVTCVAPCKGQRAAGEEPVSKLAGDGEQARRGAARCGGLTAREREELGEREGRGRCLDKKE